MLGGKRARTRRAVERGRLGERHVHLVDAESSPSRRTRVAPRCDIYVGRGARLERGDLLTQRNRLLKTFVHRRVSLSCTCRVQRNYRGHMLGTRDCVIESACAQEQCAQCGRVTVERRMA